MHLVSINVRALWFFCGALIAFAGEVSANPSPVSFIRFVDDAALPESVLDSMLQKRHVSEYAVVTVDTDALREFLRKTNSAGQESDPPSILLPLVDGTLVTVVLRGGGESYSGWETGIASFLGKVAGDEYSTVQCVIGADGSVNLVIRTAGQRYKLDETSVLPYHLYWAADNRSSQPIN